LKNKTVSYILKIIAYYYLSQLSRYKFNWKINLIKYISFMSFYIYKIVQSVLYQTLEIQSAGLSAISYTQTY